MADQSKLTDLQKDDPLNMAGGWRPSERDRRYLDNQTQAIQASLLDALLLGVVATWYHVDSASPALAIGDVVCPAGSTVDHRSVTLATDEAVEAANGTCVGMCLSPGQPGANVLVALKGTLPPAITGLEIPSEPSPFVTLNGATGRCYTNSSYDETTVVVGMIDAAANMTLGPIARVMGSSGGAGLSGDVYGELGANYIVAIRGNAYPSPGGDVYVSAGTLSFAATGTPQIKAGVGTDGLALIHGGVDVVKASVTAPAFGVGDATMRLRGGLRLETRFIGAIGAIDGTHTKDAIAWSDTSATDISITLPPPSLGRTLFIPFNGDGLVTIVRAGSELINGQAYNYVLASDVDGEGNGGGIGIAFCDGTNWIVRSIKTWEAGADLVGDVNGPPGGNWITTISGGGGPVTVSSELLTFANGVPGPLGQSTLSFSVAGTGGALEIKHGTKRVFYGHANYPELGHSEGTTQLRGALVLQPRSIIANTILDTTTKDTVAFIAGGGAAYQVTLPPASQGRMVVLQYRPPTTGNHLLKRSGAEQINGVGADYPLTGGDATGGIVVALSDGFGWIVRTLKDTPSTLAGDVTGTLGATRVEKITGDTTPSTSCQVIASELNFSGPGSSVGAKIAVGFGEALLTTHGGTSVLLAHKDAPELGNTTAVNKLHGGTVYDTRSLAADATLDVSSKETVIHVNATAAARNITLPTLATGRTFVFMIQGAYPVTIKRAGANPINGVVADYVVPYANACVIVTAISTTWLARAFSDQQGVTMGPGPGSATASASKIFGFPFAANTAANVDLTTASYTGLKTAIDAGKMLVVKAGAQCLYNWATGTITISAVATATSNPQLQGAPMFDGSESPERAPFGTTWINILGGPVAGTLTVYIAE